MSRNGKKKKKNQSKQLKGANASASKKAPSVSVVQACPKQAVSSSPKPVAKGAEVKKSAQQPAVSPPPPIVDSPPPEISLSPEVSAPPPIEVVAQEERPLPINIVTPFVMAVQSEGFYHEAQFCPAQVRLSITEDPGEPAYSGTGTAEVVSSNAELYIDADCTTPVQPLNAGVLRDGITVFVKGTAVGNVRIRLTLSDPGHPQIQVGLPAEGAVTIKPVNVIRPVIEGDELVLVDNGLKNVQWETTRSQLKLSFTQSQPSTPCPDLTIKLTYGNQIACFEDAKLEKAIASDTSIPKERLANPLQIHARGNSQGPCTVTAKLEGSAGPAWRFEADAVKEIHVERLQLRAYRFRDGGLTKADPQAQAFVFERELHAQYQGRFTLGRLQIKRPSEEFWAKASQVDLRSHGALAIYSADEAMTPKPALLKDDFSKHPEHLEFLVETTDDSAWDAQDPGARVNWSNWAARAPEKVYDIRRISCGATAVGTNKKHILGAVLPLNTFSFDQYLDRKVHNECGRRVKPNPNAAQIDDKDVALARAAGHGYYGMESKFHVNRNYRPAAAGSPFNAFLREMNFNGNAATASTRGARFVLDLLGQHGIMLHGTTVTMIRNYIESVLQSYGQSKDNGFDFIYGVPGVHAEVLAVNEMIRAGLSKSEITVATYKLKPSIPSENKQQGRRFVACPNCYGILNVDNLRIITG